MEEVNTNMVKRKTTSKTKTEMSAPNTRTRNLPITARSEDARKIFNKGRTGEICVKAYDFSGISSFRDLENYDNIVEYVCMAVVGVAMLCQFRALRPDASAARLDQLPSYRYYKKRCVLNTPGKCAAIMLACTLPEVSIHLDDDPVISEQYMANILNVYTGNEKFIEKITAQNLTDGILGHMSRILGIMNSCPSANMSAFNLDSSITKWTVKDVLEKLPLKDKAGKAISVETVISRLRSECFDWGENSIQFNELPYSGELAVEGGSAIEKDIFQDKMPVRTQATGSTNQEAKIDAPASISESDLTLLNSIELKKYESAVFLKRTDMITKYVKLVASRKLKGSKA
jgi:hypothetical protein